MYKTEDMSYRDTDERGLLIVAFNRRVFGKDARTGETVWETQLGGALVTVEIGICQGRVFASNGRVLACLDYATGEVLQTIETNANYPCRPTMLIENELLYLATSGELFCYDLGLNELWREPFAGKGLGPAALGFPGNVRQADVRD